MAALSAARGIPLAVFGHRNRADRDGIMAAPTSFAPFFRTMKTTPTLLAAALLAFSAAAHSQKLFKCVDAKGKVTYQEAACPADKDQKKVDTSHAGKTDWERAANEKIKRRAEEAEAEAAYQEKRYRKERAVREEQRRKEEKEYLKQLQSEGQVPLPK